MVAIKPMHSAAHRLWRLDSVQFNGIFMGDFLKKVGMWSEGSSQQALANGLGAEGFQGRLPLVGDAHLGGIEQHGHHGVCA